MERAKDAARLIAILAVLAMGLFLWQSRARLPEAGIGVKPVVRGKLHEPRS